MGVVSSMATAISGLEANGQALAVISDNIVNANTYGFKSARAEFQSILAQDMMMGGSEMGRGTHIGGVTTIFTQGPVTKTERGTDVAINGNGFFTLKGDTKGMTFTRDGSFRFDKDGWMTNLGGARVQAYQAIDGKISGRLGDLKIPFNTIPASATKNVNVHVNLDARTEITPPLNLERPDETAQFTSSMQIFDSIGNNHAVTMYFNRTSDSTWEWHAMTDGANIAGGTKGAPTDIANGSLTFDTSGQLFDSTQTLVNTSFANGAIPDQQMFFDFGTPANKELGPGEIRQAGSSMYGSKSAIFRSVQDGWGAGYLTDVSTDNEGIVTGIYTNGQNRLLGQLAIARFECPERLSKVGENQYRETVHSGQASIGRPTSNGRGAILTKSLENSNVDLAKEFVDMIKIQRGFQASAKSIHAANEMLDEVINLRRT